MQRKTPELLDSPPAEESIQSRIGFSLRSDLVRTRHPGLGLLRVGCSTDPTIKLFPFISNRYLVCDRVNSCEMTLFMRPLAMRFPCRWARVRTWPRKWSLQASGQSQTPCCHVCASPSLPFSLHACVCVFFLYSRAQASELWVKGEKVTCGYISEDTRVRGGGSMCLL